MLPLEMKNFSPPLAIRIRCHRRPSSVLHGASASCCCCLKGVHCRFSEFAMLSWLSVKLLWVSYLSGISRGILRSCYRSKNSRGAASQFRKKWMRPSPEI
ncbi:hypothetical protein TNIN_342541 [Trichonephila inaurata madagascariensis]|uniref:Uncharacterized protein n=1 Tax=Trichonephila inaurata madagascariensis TaxID=2747483 RepID=A0A8X6WM57_9ARAC|nr:hypothetical protein TNIN_342541 [Trichonephila inaurata madagascariensis]